MVDFIIISHSTRKPSMFDKITAFFQQNKFVVQSTLLAVVILLSSVFFYKFNSIAVGYSSRMILFLGILSAVLLFLFCLLYKCFSKKESSKTLPRFYLVILLLMGTMYSAVFLPGTVPDEPYHYESSFYYSNLITGHTNEDSLLVMRETDIKFESDALTTVMDKESYQSVRQALTDNSSNDFETTSIDGQTKSLPQTRIFSAIGISLGQLFGLNGAMTFYLGRLFNFLCFVLLAFAAYKITPVGKMLFAAITLLPMTLHITSSYSYDATIIGLSLLLIALCLKGIYSERKCSQKLLIAIPVVTFFLAPCKVLYALSALLVFLIPNSNFSSKKFAYIYKFGLMGLALFAVCIFKLPDLLNMAGISSANTDPTSDGLEHRGEESGHYHALSTLISNPLSAIFIFVNTINQKLDFYLNTFLGGFLGWFQPEIKTPWFFILLFLGILFYTARKSDIDSIIPSKKTKVVFAVLSFLMYTAVVMSMLLGWTFDTELAAEGVQGRYFLPFAPLLFLLFRTKNTQRSEDSSPIVLLSLFALNTMNLIYIWAAMARM